MLMDREQLAIAAFGGSGWADHSGGVFSPPYGLPISEINRIMGWDKPWEQRAAEAQKLMKDAGYASGFKLHMVCRNVPENQRRLVLLADVYRRLLNVESLVDAVDASRLNEMRARLDFGLWMDKLGGYVADPGENIQTWTSNNPSNFLGYSNPELDRLSQQQSVEMDLTKRVELCKGVERIILNDVVSVPLGWTIGRTGTWSYVRGYVGQDAGYMSRWMFEQVWLDTRDPAWASRPK